MWMMYCNLPGARHNDAAFEQLSEIYCHAASIRAPASAYHALFLKHALISWNMFL